MPLTQKPWLLQGERDAKYKHRLWLRFQLSTRKRKETEFIIEGYSPKGVGTKHGTFQLLLDSTCPAVLTPLVAAKVSSFLDVPTSSPLHLLLLLLQRFSSLPSPSLFVLEKWINGLGDFRVLSYFTLYLPCHSAHDIHIARLIAVSLTQLQTSRRQGPCPSGSLSEPQCQLRIWLMVGVQRMLSE